MPQTDQSKATKIDVSVIMKEIQSKAKKRALAEDLQRLNDIDIRKIVIETEEIDVMKRRPDLEKDENLSENLSYINQNFSLTSHYNFVNTHRKGLIGKLVNWVLSKLFLAIKIFIDKIVVAQEAFNVKVVRLFNRISKDLNTLSTKFDEQVKQHRELNQSLLEKIEGAKKEIIYPQLNIDYKKFEDRFRGEQSQIQERGELFLKFFHECKEVLDIGCGRGEFIQGLHRYGSGAYGIDIDSGMVAECKKKGLNVIQQDALNHLNSLPDNHLDGIFADQLVEHLSRPDIIALVALCHQKIKKDRFVILTTPNIKSMVVYANALYVDLSHITPVHPETLQFLFESAGFGEANLLFYSEVPESQKLKKSSGDKIMDENIEKLNLFLFGPQDYALIAKK